MDAAWRLGLTPPRWLPVALLALAALTACKRDTREAFAEVPARPAPLLEATLSSGETFRLSALRGKVVLLSFGYTACPDVCPTTLSQLHNLHRLLGEAARDVEVVFVSVDPSRDSAAHLENYVHAFNPRFIGLRLEGEALASVLSAYRITASRRYPDALRYGEHRFTGELPYTVDHTGAFLVIDKRGVLRLRMPYTVSVEQMRSEVERLLAEKDATAATGVRVERAHARLTPSHVGAVYLTLVNASSREDRLLSAESPLASRVELHEVLAQGDVLKMVPRPQGFVVPANGRTELKPGGKHLMLYAVRDAPSQLKLTLHFEKAGPVQLAIPVLPPGADAP